MTPGKKSDAVHCLLRLLVRSLPETTHRQEIRVQMERGDRSKPLKRRPLLSREVGFSIDGVGSTETKEARCKRRISNDAREHRRDIA